MTQTPKDPAIFFDFAEDRDIGSRKQQEDYGKFQVMDDGTPTQSLVYALADGMGGMAGGEVASRLVVNAFLHDLKNNAGSGMAEPQMLLHAMEAADASLGRLKQLESPELSAMGCTLCCAWLVDNRLYYLSVGDSLLYLIRSNKLWRLNDIHNHREDMRRLAEREGRDWFALEREPSIVQLGSRITSYIGGSGVNQVHCPEVAMELQAGDSLLVASDGILALTPREIVMSLRNESIEFPSASRCVSLLLDNVLSKRRARQDNVSIGLIRLKSPFFS